MLDVVVFYGARDMQLEAVAIVQHLLTHAAELLAQKYPQAMTSVVSPGREVGSEQHSARDGGDRPLWVVVSSESSAQIESIFHSL
jgi:hypothetical protein